jgi:hypothetical protein
VIKHGEPRDGVIDVIFELYRTDQFLYCGAAAGVQRTQSMRSTSGRPVDDDEDVLTR